MAAFASWGAVLWGSHWLALGTHLLLQCLTTRHLPSVCTLPRVAVSRDGPGEGVAGVKFHGAGEIMENVVLSLLLSARKVCQEGNGMNAD